MTDAPKVVHIPRGSRDESLRRLKVEAGNAESNMRSFANREDTISNISISQYYAGVRDGLIRAIQMLEHE